MASKLKRTHPGILKNRSSLRSLPSEPIDLGLWVRGNSLASAPIRPYHVPKGVMVPPRRKLPAVRGWEPTHHLSSPNPQRQYAQAQSPRAVRGLVGCPISAAGLLKSGVQPGCGLLLECGIMLTGAELC